MNNKIECLNCGNELQVERLYCAFCGQKKTKKILSIWALLGAFFQNIINIDSKVYSSLRKIWIPARLSEDYTAGKRQRNLGMVRFFLTVLVFHVAILAYSLRSIDLSDLNHEVAKNAEQTKLLDQFDENRGLFIEYCSDPAAIDTIRSVIFKDFAPLHDDTMHLEIFNIDFKGAGITKMDLLEKSSEEIIEKLGVDDFLTKISIKQLQKFMNDPNSMIRAIIGNILWIAILVVFLSAFFLKLIYIRHKYYLVEHVSILMHFQIFAWIVTSIVLVINMLNGADPFNSYFNVALLVSCTYLFISLKRYYKQGYTKTFIKFCSLGFIYINIILFATLFVSAISFFLF